jgi:hypothetical protein
MLHEEPQIIWGLPDARIGKLTFENLTGAGKLVGSADFFKTNEFIERLVFSPSAISKP